MTHLCAVQRHSTSSIFDKSILTVVNLEEVRANGRGASQ